MDIQVIPLPSCMMLFVKLLNQPVYASCTLEEMLTSSSGRSYVSFKWGSILDCLHIFTIAPSLFIRVQMGFDEADMQRLKKFQKRDVTTINLLDYIAPMQSGRAESEFTRIKLTGMNVVDALQWKGKKNPLIVEKYPLIFQPSPISFSNSFISSPLVFIFFEFYPYMQPMLPHL